MKKSSILIDRFKRDNDYKEKAENETVEICDPPEVTLILQKQVFTRKKFENVNSIEDVVQLIKKSSNILVISGAGVSVSCGIPDFRSDQGLYGLIEKKEKLAQFQLPQPECLFDIHYFIDDPKPFFTFAKDLFPGQYKPSPSHYFIKLLEDKGKLLRNYTQNIDGIENLTGIKKVFQCHGTFATASCLHCKKKVKSEDIRKDIFEDRIPYCEKCSGNDNVLKPDIIFFGEELPKKFKKNLETDCKKTDFVIVMGSSLKVRPVSGILGSISNEIPRILINLEKLSSNLTFDVELIGYCDQIVNCLANSLNWELNIDEEQATKKLKTEQTESPSIQPEYQYYPPSTYLFEGGKWDPKIEILNKEISRKNNENLNENEILDVDV